MDGDGNRHSGVPTLRLKSVVDDLAQRGISQAKVAAAVGVSRQFLNDIVCARRPVSELLARRVAEQFEIDFSWLLGQPSRAPKTAAFGGADTGVWLPVLPHPVEGDPREHPRWEGTFIQVPPIAMPTLAGAVQPYVLRFGQNDVENRLHKHDLILVSQTRDEKAPIVVALSGRKCFLARRKAHRWVRLANGVALGSDVRVVGHCLGILWSALTSVH
jgi:transcriptional regulator with XRE-family HTH domain